MNFFGLALIFGCASLFVEGASYERRTLQEEGGRYVDGLHEGEDHSPTLSEAEQRVQRKYAAFIAVLKSGDPELTKPAKKRIEAKLNDFMVLLKDTEEGGRYVDGLHEGEDHSPTLSEAEQRVQRKYAAFIAVLKSGDPELTKPAKKRIEAKLNDFMVLLKDTENKQKA
uniref:Putative secreted protein n=1 Tax=Ixodes ricinus TaxID=34613 RepID=A0A6B0UYP5_IXORI